MKTSVYLGHPDLTNSSSQNFLLAAGKDQADVTFFDLNQVTKESLVSFRDQIRASDQIILQFPLYWYQAPALVKNFIDLHLGELSRSDLEGKYMGLVVVVGSKADDYQAGTLVNRTMSELLSPFEAFANYKGMYYRPVFPIYQFQYLDEIEKMHLIWRYRFYLKGSKDTSLAAYSQYLLDHARDLAWGQDLDPISAYQWQDFLDRLEANGQELLELRSLTQS